MSILPPIVIAVVWIAAHFALYVGVGRSTGHRRDEASVLADRLVSATALARAVLVRAMLRGPRVLCLHARVDADCRGAEGESTSG